MPVTSAVDLVEITDRCFQKWMALGRKSQGDEYIRFFRAIKKARGQFILKNLRNIETAAKEPRNWTASAWLLERRDAENFGKRETEQLAAQEKRIAALEALLAERIKEKPKGGE